VLATLGAGLRCPGWVALTGLKQNPWVATYVRRWSEAAQAGKPLPARRTIIKRCVNPRQPVSERLDENDLRTLVEEFKSGTSKKDLAKRYKISDSSVKRVLRERGASPQLSD
jgi:DNA invertase Pin-like site-specific DNA recombinase